MTMPCWKVRRTTTAVRCMHFCIMINEEYKRMKTRIELLEILSEAEDDVKMEELQLDNYISFIEF